MVAKVLMSRITVAKDSLQCLTGGNAEVVVDLSRFQFYLSANYKVAISLQAIWLLNSGAGAKLALVSLGPLELSKFPCAAENAFLCRTGSLPSGVEKASAAAGQWEERKLRWPQGPRPPMPADPPAPT